MAGFTWTFHQPAILDDHDQRQKPRKSLWRQPKQSAGFNFLLYTLVFGAILLAVFSYVSRFSVDEISYDDLIRLAESTKYESPGGKLSVDGKIVVESDVGEKSRI